MKRSILFTILSLSALNASILCDTQNNFIKYMSAVEDKNSMASSYIFNKFCKNLDNEYINFNLTAVYKVDTVFSHIQLNKKEDLWILTEQLDKNHKLDNGSKVLRID